jgi:hypothetical protein
MMRKTYTEGLEQVLGLLVDVELTAVAVLGEVERGNLWHVLILPLTLLFLQLEGDTADWTTLDALHQMGGVASNLALLSDIVLPPLVLLSRGTHLVPQPLRRNDGDLIADALVGLEVQSELGVVALDDDLGRLLDCLRPDTTHVCGILRGMKFRVSWW